MSNDPTESAARVAARLYEIADALGSPPGSLASALCLYAESIDGREVRPGQLEAFMSKHPELRGDFPPQARALASFLARWVASSEAHARGVGRYQGRVPTHEALMTAAYEGPPGLWALVRRLRGSGAPTSLSRAA